MYSSFCVWQNVNLNFSFLRSLFCSLFSYLSVLLWQLQRVGAFPLFVYPRKLFFSIIVHRSEKAEEVSEWFIYQFDGRKTDLSRVGIEEIYSIFIQSIKNSLNNRCIFMFATTWVENVSLEKLMSSLKINLIALTFKSNLGLNI